MRDSRNDRQAERERPYWIRITGQAAGTNRYAWSQADDTDVVSDPPFPEVTGDFSMSGTSAALGWPAYEVTGRTDVPTDGTAIVRATVSASGKFWTFRYDGPGSVAGECDAACGSLVSLADDACLELELVCATGSFANIDTSQFDGVYAFGSGGTWTFEKWDGDSWEPVVIDYLGGSGGVVFTWNDTPLPTLTLDGISLTPACPPGADATFRAGPRNPITGDPEWVPEGDCPSNELVLRVSCICCPIDGFEGDGWYCLVAAGETCGVDTPGCAYLSLDDGSACDESIQICGGPYDSQSECQAACTGGGFAACADAPAVMSYSVVSDGCLNGHTDTITEVAGPGDRDWEDDNGPSPCSTDVGFTLRCTADVWTATYDGQSLTLTGQTATTLTFQYTPVSPVTGTTATFTVSV